MRYPIRLKQASAAAPEHQFLPLPVRLPASATMAFLGHAGLRADDCAVLHLRCLVAFDAPMCAVLRMRNDR